MLSEAAICNLALARVGQREFIESLTEASTSAQVCAVHYVPARDAMLEAFFWPFATRRSSLALLDGVTRSGWAYAFALPTDFLFAQHLFNGARPGQPAAPYPWLSGEFSGVTNANTLPAISGQVPALPFAIEANDATSGLILLCDQNTADLSYTARVTNTALFPQLFSDALAWRLAVELALSLTVKPQVAAMLDKKADAALSRAKANALNGQQADPWPDSQFIAVRG